MDEATQKVYRDEADRIYSIFTIIKAVCDSGMLDVSQKYEIGVILESAESEHRKGACSKAFVGRSSEHDHVTSLRTLSNLAHRAWAIINRASNKHMNNFDPEEGE